MSIQQRERTLEVWDGAETLNNARIHEAVLCIAPGELTRQELHLVAGDAQIIKSMDEAPSMAEASYTSVVVFAAGLELARELLQINALDGTGRIHWHLGMDLMETLEILSRLELPFGVRVESTNHAAPGTVVTTGLTTGGMLDTLSFHRGVQAGSLHRTGQTATGQATAPDTERLLQQKLLHTLQTIEPLIDAAPSCTGLHDGDAETQLIVLKRKYDALERKYTSLAASQMGKLTLRLWARKRRSRSRFAAATKAP
ncbi:hypothetical protein ART_1283 [Arthrobacter sp. PAMC 25486]|uniref:hypothetical protein n=1 Tax=Arthrobacter sp. PAMC 25486 TaxID=1494608 RepID=UPI000535E6AF|nr:hypothetical protein [Arthrobacter sp. PAMC 25486]AIY00882.1 hypothetical protein ART_1283 [Arthrobacter sp. PAMC 25486]